MTNPTTSAAAPRAVRRYLGRLAAFLCALALPFALLIGFIGFVPETSQQSLLYTLHYKLDLLRDTRGQGNRILIAGGSASEYGVNCAAIAEATARPTYCVGVTAYLGVEMYLNMLTRYAEPGDTVILMLEHLLLRGAGVDYQVLWQACGTEPDAWACVPPTLYLGRRRAPGSTWPAAGRQTGRPGRRQTCAGQATATRPVKRRTAMILGRWAMSRLCGKTSLSTATTPRTPSR